MKYQRNTSHVSLLIVMVCERENVKLKASFKKQFLWVVLSEPSVIEWSINPPIPIPSRKVIFILFNHLPCSYVGVLFFQPGWVLLGEGDCLFHARRLHFILETSILPCLLNVLLNSKCCFLISWSISICSLSFSRSKFHIIHLQIYCEIQY